MTIQKKNKFAQRIQSYVYLFILLFIFFQKQLETIYHYIQYFSKGLLHNNTIIRNFNCRIIAALLKNLAQYEISLLLDEPESKNILQDIIQLVRQKSSKIIGIKLASYLQHLVHVDLQNELNVIKKELELIYCQDSIKENRRAAMLNISLTDENISSFIQRTRDFDVEIRKFVFVKLKKDNLYLANLNLSDVYKLIYDGLNSRNENIEEECLSYLASNFHMFISDNDMQQQNKLFEEMKSQSFNQKIQLIQEQRMKILNFMTVFQVQQALLYPKIMHILIKLTEKFYTKILHKDVLESYLEYLIKCILLSGQKTNETLQLRSSLTTSQNKCQLGLQPEELFLIYVILLMINEDENKYLYLNIIIEEHFPNGKLNLKVLYNTLIGIEFSKLTDFYFQNQQLFEFWICENITRFLINTDEIGKQEIRQKQLLYIQSNDSFTIKLQQQKDESQNEYNDLYFQMNDEKVQLLKSVETENSIKIIQSSDDISILIVLILQKIDPTMYITDCVKVISLIRDPILQDEEDEESYKFQLQRFYRDIERCDDMISKQNSNKKELYIKQKKEIKQQINQIFREIQVKNYKAINLIINLLQSSLDIKELKNNAQFAQLFSKHVFPIFQQSYLNELDQELVDKRFNDLTQQKLFHCLSLYFLQNKDLVLEYFQIFFTIIQQNIDQYSLNEKVQSNPILNIVLKGIFDIFIYHNLIELETPISNSEDCDQIPTPQELIDDLALLLVKSESYTQLLLVEGFSRLIYLNKLRNREIYILLLFLLIWHDHSNNSFEIQESTQILSSFFKNYIKRNMQSMAFVEQSVECFFYFYGYLLIKRCDLNHSFFKEDLIEQKKKIIVQTCLTQMSYEFNKENPVYKQLNEINQSIEQQLNEKEFFTPPQERFFIFLCKIISTTNSSYQSYKKNMSNIFCQLLPNFDFVLHQCNPYILAIVFISLSEVIGYFQYLDDQVFYEISLEAFENFNESILNKLKKICSQDQNEKEIDAQLLLQNELSQKFSTISLQESSFSSKISNKKKHSKTFGKGKSSKSQYLAIQALMKDNRENAKLKLKNIFLPDQLSLIEKEELFIQENIIQQKLEYQTFFKNLLNHEIIVELIGMQRRSKTSLMVIQEECSHEFENEIQIQ